MYGIANSLFHFWRSVFSVRIGKLLFDDGKQYHDSKFWSVFALPVLEVHAHEKQLKIEKMDEVSHHPEIYLNHFKLKHSHSGH